MNLSDIEYEVIDHNIVTIYDNNNNDPDNKYKQLHFIYVCLFFNMDRGGCIYHPYERYECTGCLVNGLNKFKDTMIRINNELKLS